MSSGRGLRRARNSLDGAQGSRTDGTSQPSIFGWYVEPRITGTAALALTGLRLDGGSAYGARVTGPAVRLLPDLPKLNGSWVISEEPFFPFKACLLLAPVARLPTAKRRCSRARPTGCGSTPRQNATDRTDVALALTTLGNTELEPERSTEFEGGFDADLLDSRLSLELTRIGRLQVDALMPVSLPRSVQRRRDGATEHRQHPEHRALS